MARAPTAEVDSFATVGNDTRYEALRFVAAAGFGAVTPFCSCSTVPALAGLLQAGAPIGLAFSFDGIGVAAATTGLVHPAFAMIAMVLSVSAVLASSFAGQLLSDGGLDTEFAVHDGDAEGIREEEGTAD